MKKQESEIVIEMTKSCIDYINEVDPEWEILYMRYSSDDLKKSVQGSYVKREDVALFPVLGFSWFYDEMHVLCESLRNLQLSEKKKFKACLLRVDSKFQYNIYFDYEDVNRWEITKLDGKNGIPEGLDKEKKGG